MPKKALTVKFQEKHPKKDFYKALEDSFDGTWDTLVENFNQKYGIKANIMTLKKYFMKGVDSNKIKAKIPKAKKRGRGKKSIVDIFNEKYPNKDFNECLRECYEDNFNTVSNNFKKKYDISVGNATLKKYLIENNSDIKVEPKKRKGKKSFIDKFNENHDIDFYDAVNEVAKSFSHIDQIVFDKFQETYRAETSFQTFKRYVEKGIKDGKVNLTIKKGKRGKKNKTIEEKIRNFEMQVKEMVGTQKTNPAVIKCKSCGEELPTTILKNCCSLAVFFRCPYCRKILGGSEIMFTYNKQDYIKTIQDGKTIFLKNGKQVKNPAWKAIKANDLNHSNKA